MAAVGDKIPSATLKIMGEKGPQDLSTDALFAGKKVVIRTLDAGSDKPLKFANSPDEPNPALGVPIFT